ncbi:Uncharacterized protein HZ326_23678 [Fusarium oxysporum f. sp. albedinis]|nr:Uncharacterized protein HZ326_23678 [Fusarium oxysporum f. sp. albedinis]
MEGQRTALQRKLGQNSDDVESGTQWWRNSGLGRLQSTQARSRCFLRAADSQSPCINSVVSQRQRMLSFLGKSRSRTVSLRPRS